MPHNPPETETYRVLPEPNGRSANKWPLRITAALVISTLLGLYIGSSLADYSKGIAASSGTIGMPNLVVRRDTAADDAGGNLLLGRLNTDSAGSLRTTHEGGKATYTATSQFTCDSTATDIAYFAGNATKTVKLLKIYVSTTATAAATGNLSIIRRTAANTAGTAVSAALGQFDILDAAPQSLPKHYTAHPTALGASAAPGGTIYSENIVQAALATGPATKTVIDFQSWFGSKACRISGTTDIVAINVPAALGGSGNVWAITWLFTEAGLTE